MRRVGRVAAICLLAFAMSLAARVIRRRLIFLTARASLSAQVKLCSKRSERMTWTDAITGDMGHLRSDNPN